MSGKFSTLLHLIKHQKSTLEHRVYKIAKKNPHKIVKWTIFHSPGDQV